MNRFAASLVLVLASCSVWSDSGYILGKVKLVVGSSMEPSLRSGDQVVLNRVSSSTLRKGDLVALKFRTRENLMVKRLMAVEGENIVFSKGKLFLDDEPLNEKWWPEGERLEPRQQKFLSLQLSRLGGRVPKGSAMVMGDGRNSFDSGDYGLVSYDQIVGRIEKQIEGAGR